MYIYIYTILNYVYIYIYLYIICLVFVGKQQQAIVECHFIPSLQVLKPAPTLGNCSVSEVQVWYRLGLWNQSSMFPHRPYRSVYISLESSNHNVWCVCLVVRLWFFLNGPLMSTNWRHNWRGGVTAEVGNGRCWIVFTSSKFTDADSSLRWLKSQCPYLMSNGHSL